MKVAVVNAPAGLENLVVTNLAEPTPGSGEVLVRVHASSLNFHDYGVVLGRIQAADGRIPMSDGAGEVVAVGAGVTTLKPGDRVLSLFFPNWPVGRPTKDRMTGVPGDHVDGFAAELVAAPASAFTRVPEGWSYMEAATLPCAALTAWRALMVHARIKPGDVVLTQGTGGVSIFALQFAKAMGCEVIATSSSDAKLEWLKELGADHLINYKQQAEWGQAVMSLTDGRGADVVVEVGGPGTMAQSLQAVRIDGHIALIGVLTGVAGVVPTAVAMGKNVAIKGVTVGSREDQEDMINALEASDIRPVIDTSFPLEAIGDAFAHQAAKRHFGKICLEIA
ncbi:NAD(P)-dependent alcohol dehydrogenase [Sphingobium sp. EM0848]|uniref:zinc-dependent alcohol dehydrogenase family protein n=1 Tax=Sphingobium sp. EM0848 TaxID=2743473 RepID=UPI00159C54BF|nr:NAD(P)-dependent alcohol dehydrogenase [Sphingobium sp. EM0848]